MEKRSAEFIRQSKIIGRIIQGLKKKLDTMPEVQAKSTGEAIEILQKARTELFGLADLKVEIERSAEILHKAFEPHEILCPVDYDPEGYASCNCGASDLNGHLNRAWLSLAIIDAI